MHTHVMHYEIVYCTHPLDLMPSNSTVLRAGPAQVAPRVLYLDDYPVIKTER
jgi:hypothetical protein